MSVKCTQGRIQFALKHFPISKFMKPLSLDVKVHVKWDTVCIITCVDIHSTRYHQLKLKLAYMRNMYGNLPFGISIIFIDWTILHLILYMCMQVYNIWNVTCVPVILKYLSLMLHVYKYHYSIFEEHEM